MTFLDKAKRFFAEHWGTVKVDEALGDEPLQQALAGIKNGSLDAAVKLLEQTREGKWDERCEYITVLAKNSLVMTYQIESARQRDPKNSIYPLLRGAGLVFAAWQARGAGTSDTVSGLAQKLFEDNLRQAEQFYLQAAALDPADPTPYALLIYLELGLSLGADTVDSYLEQALQRHPNHFQAHLNYLSTLTQKWGGSHEDMFAFARDAIQEPQADGLLAGLIFYAHIERWLYHSFEEPDPEKYMKLMELYLARLDAQQETIRAYERLKQSLGTHNRLATIRAMNLAGFWFYLRKDTQRLKEIMEYLGYSLLERPWQYDLNDANTTWKSARMLVGLPPT